MCTWEIVASPGNMMLLNIRSISLVESYNCNDNYLEVREFNETGTLLGVFCGNEAPANLTKAAKYWVRYRTDDVTLNPGFLAEYSYQAHSNIQGKSGVITSPLYPRFLFNSREQSYRIFVEHGFAIRLEFPDFVMGDEDCFSYVRLYDGYDDTATVLENELCSAVPETVTSQTNVLYIVFMHNHLTKSKFRINWSQVNKVSIVNETVNECQNQVVMLNNVTQHINITSPGYSSGYATQLECSWIVSSGIPSMHPLISFKDIDIEETPNCTADHIDIYSTREDSSWKLLDKLCSFDMRSQLVYDGTPDLKITFTTDYGVNKSGFNAFAVLGCGGAMKGPEGVIEVDPIRYVYQNFLTRSATNCIWNITVGMGRQIKFKFVSLNLTRNSECDSYVTIKNGIDDSSPKLGDGLYCGNSDTLPEIPLTTGNRAFVKFSQRQMLFLGKFTLTYEEVSEKCGEEVRLSSDSASGIITSPNYPNIPNAHTECSWVVVAPIGESIRVDFIERFDLNYDLKCEHEYVELRDGSTQNARLIGTYCREKPMTIHTQSNVLRVKYFTDLTDPKNGFKANISIATCGGTRRSNIGVINSPKYPGLGAYPSNSVCEYRIVGNPNSIFNLKFLELDLPSTENGKCNLTQDHVVVYSLASDMADQNGTTEILEEIGVYCGDSTGSPFVSDTNEVLIVFKTFQPNTVYKGYSIHYNITKLSCGGSLEMESGIIESPGYPARNLNRGLCEWKITVPHGRRVRVEFLDFDLVQTTNR